MNPSLLLEFERLSPDDQDAVDRLCDQFEQAVRSGETVRIEEYVARIEGEAARRTAVNQLVALEIYHGRGDRDSSTIDGYEARFPDYCQAVTAAVHETATLFAPDSEVGPFRIERQLGAGGMGVVYLARDRRLDREVALKFLPPAVSDEKWWLKRFHREAKILAGLTHPHIATLYGFEELEGLHVCVMEYVPGRTMADMLAETDRVPLDEIRRIFEQVGSALEFAHSRGVIHRDLKPANILIKPDGNAKLLDFGLASNLDAALGETADGLSDVEALRLAGTVPYMSPEQVRGGTVDKRADIWAFGCCLYEALTGVRAFRGECVADVVSAILSSPPQWDKLPDDTPPALRFVLKRSMEKDPARRLRDIGDAWLSEEVLADFGDARLQVSAALASPEKGAQVDPSRESTTSGIAGTTWRRWIPWCLFAAATIGCIVAWFRPGDSPAPAAISSVETLPPAQHLALDQYGPLGEPRRSIAVSPDGEWLAYSAADSEQAIMRPQIYLKRLGAFDEPIRLARTEGAYHLFFSPDSRWIGFFANGKLKKIATSGDPLVPLCEVSFPVGGTWSDDGNIYVGDSFGDRLVTIHEDGGPSSTIEGSWRDKRFQWIEALPGGNGLLSSSRGTGLTHIDPKSGQPQVLLSLDVDVHPFYAAERLFYAFDGRLMSGVLDLDRLAIESTPIPVLHGVRTGQWGVGQFAISEGGTLAYVPGISGRKSRLVRIPEARLTTSDDKVVADALPFEPENFGMLALSPDGQSLAIEIHKKTTDIWRYDVRTGNRKQLTFLGNNRQPVWSPDSKWIAFSSDRDGDGMNLFRKSALNESSAAVRLTPKTSKIEYLYSWSRDNEIAYREMVEEGHALKTFHLSEGKAVRIRPLTGVSYVSQVCFSPDGQWVVYTDWQPGDRASVKLQRYPSSGDNWTVSGAEGGEEAVWSQSGDKIVYRIGVTWMSVDFQEPSTDGGAPRLSRPRRLFSGNYINVSGMSYDMSSNGDFFLLESLQDPEPNRIRVVHNWLETWPPKGE